MKKLILLTFYCCSALFAHAQDFEYGKVGHIDNDFDKKVIDSNANAVVLREFGTSRMQLDDITGYLMIYFEYHIKIKIYNKDGFNAANVLINTHKSGDRKELVNNIKGSTYNYENGRFVESIMDRKAIFNEEKSKYRDQVKFTLPNIKAGSVIEYSYVMQSPFIFNFKEWYFQSNIPKVHSEYVAFIPANYNYNVVLRGFNKLSDQKSEISKECLRLSGVPIDCSKMTYIMKNVPAFVEEDFMTAPTNFLSAMYFELSDVQQVNGSKQSYTKSWKDIDYELISDKRFGQQMKRKDVFKDIIPIVTKDANNDLAKAKAIYNYIQKQIKWNNYYGNYCEETIKTILDRRYGNVGEVNLSLIAALNAADLDAEAIILSTRENGLINKLFPVISEFNYVIARIKIGDQYYMLDATDPLLPFGMLPLRCLNDQGRVISATNKKQASYWVDLISNDKRTTRYFLDGELKDNGIIKGTIAISNIGYAGYNKRREIKQYNSVDEYAEKLSERLIGIKILSHQINNVDEIDQPLLENYKFEIQMRNAGNDNLLALNPFIINPISKNPFNLNQRMYPVDMGSEEDERITIKIKLPASYTLQDQPKDLSIALPQNGAKYLLQTQLLGQDLNINQVKQLNKPIYQSDEYLYLKEFYSRIIQNQKTDLQIKKNNP